MRKKSINGEPKYSGLGAVMDALSGSAGAPSSFTTHGFLVIHNPTGAIAVIDGVRLRPRSGIIKTQRGESVISFDEDGGVTHDTQLAAPILAAFAIPEG